MIVDNAIQEFTEKYNRDAIMSIDTISKDLGLNTNGHTLKGFINIQESFDKFNSFLRGYGEYVVKFNESTERSSVSTIKNDFTNSLPKFFENKDYKYNELPGYISSYVEGVNSLINTVDTVKGILFENNIDPEYIAAINEFTDNFFGKLQESFDSSMDHILWASGYNARKRIAERVNKTVSSSKPVFL